MDTIELDRSQARKKAEDNSKYNDMKQHADKLIQGFQKLSDSHAKRAIWELFQNAIDLAEHAEIEIEHTKEALIFSHNGKPFDDNTLNCLIKQVSSKSAESNDEEIGQYGTGFITTHSFGRRILLSGSLKNEEIYIPLHKFDLDRTARTSPELIIELVKQQDAVFDLIENGEYSHNPVEFTEFAYITDSDLQKKYALEAINSLPFILPYVMTLNKRLQKVTVINEADSTWVYKKGESITKGDVIESEIKINSESIKIYTIENVEPQITVILPLKENHEAYIFNPLLSKLFLYYPLIGTELLGMNFIIHSKHFKPTEQRDGIYLNSNTEQVQENEAENRKLIERASEVIFDYIQANASAIRNPIHLAQINFNVNSDKPLLNKYFLELKTIWIDKFKTFPLVETEIGNLQPCNTLFFHNELLGSADTFDSIYALVSKYWTNIPKKELVNKWTNVINEWNIESITYLTLKDLVLKIQEDGCLGEFNNTDNLHEFYEYLIENGHGDFFNLYKLLPNIKGEFRQLSGLNNNISLPDVLIKIAEVIMPDVPKRHIHSDFKFNLELTAYNRKNYTTEINAAIATAIKDDSSGKVIPLEFLTEMVNYCKITSSSDNNSIPSKMVKLICQYYNYSEDLIEILTIKDDELDIRTPQKKLIRLFLNDVSKEDSDWVTGQIDFLKHVIESGASYYDYEEMFKTLPVFPNQLNELTIQTYLKIDDNIPDGIKELYNEVVKPSYPIKANLVLEGFEENLKDKEKRTVRSLTEKIESIFFEDTINFSITEHPFKTKILELIGEFKISPEYEKYFPLLFTKKSSILVEMADGEDTFSILSLDGIKIKKLAEIAKNPDFDEIIRLGKEALIAQKQEKANFQHKYAIGTHIEKILRKHLAGIIPGEIKAETKDVQDGQDIIIKINNQCIYFIEVKSRWDTRSSVRMSKNQTLTSYEERKRYALCSVDMSKYVGEDRFEVSDIELIKDLIRFVINIGDLVEHLIDTLKQTSETTQIHLDGDYKTLIPQTYIEDGITIEQFELFLIQFLKDHV